MGKKIANLRVASRNGKCGLFALEPISEGAAVIDFRNEELLPSPTRRSVQIDEGKHVIGRPETVGYLNHSCEPNVWIDVCGMCVRALRNIQKGEEITFNYLTTEYAMHDGFQCDCGSPACYGMILGFKHLNPQQQLALKPCLAPYLRRKLEPSRELKAS